MRAHDTARDSHASKAAGSKTAHRWFAVVAAAGVAAALFQLTHPRQVLTTAWGTLLLARVTLLVVLGGFGWWHRRRTIPTLVQSDGAAGPRSRFVRLGAAEAMVMALAVGVASLMTAGIVHPPVYE
jgi:putative copper export protein